ncbi:MAG: type II secretion system protein [Planctomycetota bacterium]
MRRSQSGFTLIELLIVISIIGVLAAVLVPELMGVQGVAYVEADSQQLRKQNTWLMLYKQKHKKALPRADGHKFVMSLWTSNIFPHKEENLDFFFTPGARDNDPDYRDAREQMELGEDPWPDLGSTSTLSTHYVGRAREHLRSATRATAALMANDNEGVSTHADGTVNVLFADGNVRTYSFQDLQGRFGIGDFNPDDPIQTWGENSPIPECQKLAN